MSVNDEVFGPFIDATVLEQAVLDTLQKWLHTALGRVEQAAPDVAYGEIVRPKSWQPDRDLRDLDPEQNLPAVKVAVGAGEPWRDAESLHMSWPFAVGPVVAAPEPHEARRIAHYYAHAVLAALMWNRSLGGVISGLEFTGPDRLDQVTGNQQVSYALVPMQFTATVADVLSLTARPTVPDPLPDPEPGEEPEYPPVPTAETVQVTTHHLDQEG